jgi:pSer/pThr/pTyr-binding forkhead associated (FHA) protein
MAELIIQSGKLQGKRLVLPAKELVVGRDEDCDLRISSSLVSRKHCIIKNTPAGILVTDLGSQNGTHVNDLAITEPTLLREGDTLRIGATMMAVPVATKPKATGASSQSKISDAEIADWLTDSGSSSPGSDTAVIAAYTPVAERPASPPPPAKPPSSARVLPVKDEAAEIIRKHWEAIKAKHKG